MIFPHIRDFMCAPDAEDKTVMGVRRPQGPDLAGRNPTLSETYLAGAMMREAPRQKEAQWRQHPPR